MFPILLIICIDFPTVQCTLYSVHCTVCTLYVRTVYIGPMAYIQCALYTVHICTYTS